MTAATLTRPTTARDWRDAGPTDLPDLTGIDLRTLVAMPDSALGVVLARVKAELERPQDAVAGFQSAI